MLDRASFAHHVRLVASSCLCVGLIVAGATAALAVDAAVAAEEMQAKVAWVKENLLTESAAPPFSFAFDGKSSVAILPGWKREASQKKLDDNRIEHTLLWTDAQSGLVVRCRAVEYLDYPTVEWTVYLKNASDKNSPLIERLESLDLKIQRRLSDEFVLHYQQGDDCSAHSYEPHEAILGAGESKAFSSAGGRPTNGGYPYYNLAYDGGGLIAVLGWPGQWAARFQREGDKALVISGGQELTHFVLLPGEEVRTPLSVLQFWKGDRTHAQNVWRRWMIAHNIPRPGGKLPQPQTSACMGLHQSEAGEIGFIDGYLKGGAKIDYWWMDAGWYPSREWWTTGTWEPDPERFPHGIRAVSDYAHSKGMKLVLWFEPERVRPETWLDTNHPEWLLGKPGDNRLLNLGNKEAWTWLTNHIDKFITTQGVDLYRQDFNFDPLGYWRGADAPDRQGITEIRHVEGYLAYWDELLRRHPNMMIDSCSSGGRRNDLETLRRSVPLLRSDFQLPQNPAAADMLVGNQGHTYGLSFWVPYYGTGMWFEDVYAFRSHMTPWQGIGYQTPVDKVDWEQFRHRTDEWRSVAERFYGDYYPLTPYSLAEDAWIGWQFDRPEAGDGMIQAFRRPQNKVPSLVVKLFGLRSDAIYEVTDLDQKGAKRFAGQTLLTEGLTITQPRPRSAALIAYQRIDGLAAVLAPQDVHCEVGEEVLFTAKDSKAQGGAIAAYAWDFGDQASAGGPQAVHSFGKAGTYTVAITVKDAQGASDQTTTQVTVEPIDTTPPTILSAASGKPDRVAVIFSKLVDKASAETTANYAIDGNAAIQSVTLAPDGETVKLATSPLATDKTYTLTVNNVKDCARTQHVIHANSKQTFRCSGMLGWWALNEGACNDCRDYSGNASHGKYSDGEGLLKWGEGRRGYAAVEFDGQGGIIETETHLADLAMPFTIALWVKPAATQCEYATILGNHGEPFVGINLQQDGNATNKFGFGYGDGKQWQGSGHAQLKADVWQHVAIVCNGEKSLLYIDGEEKSAGPGKGPVAVNSNQCFKLGQGYHTGRYFRGMLSDVRIYCKAMSAKEVAEMAKAADTK